MEKIIKLRGVRGVIAKNMADSLQNTAQYSLFAEVNATELMAARQQLKDTGQPVGYEDLIVSVLCKAIAAHPIINGRIKDKEIHLSEDIHMGYAVPTSSGLNVPVLFNAETKSLFELNEQRRDLIERAQSGTLTVKEMTEGTFTISNLGLTRVNHFTPILNYPQISLLGLGQITKRPWVLADGSIGVQPIMGLSLTVDHRIIDGDIAGYFLTELCEKLESPLI